MISNSTTILAITLARGGSKRIPQKNLAVLVGLPLLVHTFNEVKKSQFIDRYIVSTDDPHIMDLCIESQVEYHSRPTHLATDTATSADALLDVVQNCKPFDYVVEIMCTNPLKNVSDIDGCIQKLHLTSSDAVVSVSRIYDHHPSRVKFIENDVLKDFYSEKLESRRQDLTPPAYVRNGSIYAMTRELLLTTRTRLGPCPRPYIMPPERTINIDEPIDLLIAEQMMEKKM